jgi:tripartite-type tricarboxylate transporter receptor subunit TctC
MKSCFLKAAILFLAAITVARAEYPERPVQIVVPFAAGGTVDIIARLVGEPLGKSLGTTIVIDNRAGASGMIGSQYVANSKADGYTLLANSSIHVIVPGLYPKIAYDALNDFQPISMISSVPLVLVASPSAPFKSFQDLVAWGKQQPGGVSYASAGNGSTPHLAGELLGKEAHLKVVHVPYKGSGAAMIDVMGGQVPLMFDALTAVMNNIKAGKLRALAVAGMKRSPMLPDVPTFAELGYADFDLSTWHGVWAPRKTPGPVVEKLAKELRRISQLPEVQKRVQDLGGIVVGSSPEEFEAFERREHQRWGEMIKRLNITVD